MRILHKILITFAMVVGLSLAVSAQKDDQKKTPPKGTPPVVNPQPKPPPPDPNKKKPGGEVIYIVSGYKQESA